jgi:hypothetical protein
VGGWVGGGNSSSKAFGISFADRPKAKISWSVMSLFCSIYKSGTMKNELLECEAIYASGVGLLGFEI